MKRSKLLGALLVIGFFVAGTASAQMGMMRLTGLNGGTVVQTDQSPVISKAIQDIYTSQQVTTQSQIDCAKVTDTEFENLGDAVMGFGITEAQHTAMENMMGGEGSPTLKQAHVNMGRSYLGCWANYQSGPVTMPMMGYYYSGTASSVTERGSATLYAPAGMMGSGYGRGGMMNGYWGGQSGFGSVTMVLIWALLIVCIVAVVKWSMKKK